MIALPALGLALVALQAAPEVPPRVVTAEAPIVAGNAASAKDRALTEAFRQAVERRLAALLLELGVPEPAPPAVAQLRGTLFSRARRFVRSWKILEQAEEAGKVRLVVDAEIDDASLRREIERGQGGGAPPRTGAAAVVIAGSPADAVDALVRALVAMGSRASVVATPDEARAREAATRAAAAAAVMLTASVTAEGPVRGTPRTAASCRIAARVLSTGGAPTTERTAEARAFADGEGAARSECLARGAAELARQLASTTPSTPTEGRAVTLDLDLVEPAVLASLLQALRKLGAAEVRRVAVGHVEVRVTTRLAPAALVATLARDVGAGLTITPGPTGPDRAAVQVRLPTALAPPQ